MKRSYETEKYLQKSNEKEIKSIIQQLEEQKEESKLKTLRDLMKGTRGVNMTAVFEHGCLPRGYVCHALVDIIDKTEDLKYFHSVRFCVVW